ncbi:hypothetical protein NDU88_001653 [Pleurodeles waltl]|uniref:Uncharacterized protein n=1 Tax=Pleurodeles waltl TaxID=8319 RepID=A0AAV7UUU3_PLEWA|nr:hypothetical protein NDU88_001653 [Pleurodeles waltl]
MLRLFPFGRTPGGFPPGVSRSPGPSSTVTLVACCTLLTSLRSPGGPHRRGRSHRGSFAARLDPAEISSSKRLGRRNSHSRLRRTGARRSPGHRELRSQLGAARSPTPPGPALQAPAPAPPRQRRTPGPSSYVKEQAAPSQFSRGFRLRRPFSCSCRVARAGLRFATTHHTGTPTGRGDHRDGQHGTIGSLNRAVQATLLAIPFDGISLFGAHADSALR